MSFHRFPLSRPPASHALKRAKVANYVVQSCYDVDTRDHEDHTFSGIMFDMKCKDDLPLEYIEIHKVWVRGYLGPMTVWVTPNTFKGKRGKIREWKLVHKAKHKRSMQDLSPLEIKPCLRLRAGESIGIYIHSGLEGDMGIVYNNRRSRVTHEDPHMCIMPGLAHISDEPFSCNGFWGGGAWRYDREFVGRMTYGVKWMLWNPVQGVHGKFPKMFKQMVYTILMCHRRKESTLNKLPGVVLYYIFNMLPWDWAGQEDIKARITKFERNTRDTSHSYRRRFMNLSSDEEKCNDDDDDDDDEDYVDMDEDDGSSY
eukprot:CAMPEP_0184480030 /NCGR_PEP_ID=MMETSP0113_2-20130426/1518_1 /TAXON_ID=91329 /ORGANISM="Norrisiella sphaerica, Strain BC52" /LENGTH=312 /DNA_ID=CAMNT_0026858239 /DNA_START=93 /DNA_END=1031 /DNA_ORIENTATION=-